MTTEHKAQNRAIMAHGLMLLNLLFPLLIYCLLTGMWWRHRNSPDAMLYVAVNQAWWAATVSTLLFVLANGMIITLAQYQSTFALITFEVYFIFIVPIFLIPGLLGLVKSHARQIYYYPLLGARFR